jgi:L-lactate dehydrogenase (cytochrome)
MLSHIVDTVGDQTEVMFDSGIRSGQDVLKAIALGAKGTMIGRAYTYGLGAKGQQGVTDALRVIHKELDMTMGLCGRTRMSGINHEILMVPDGFHRK